MASWQRSVTALPSTGAMSIVWWSAILWYLLFVGLFAYGSGCIIVVEDLSNSRQRHLTGETMYVIVILPLSCAVSTVLYNIYSTGGAYHVFLVQNDNVLHVLFLSPGHSEEVSTLAALGDGKVLASSSHAHNSTPCEIRIWQLPTQKCCKVRKSYALADVHVHVHVHVFFPLPDCMYICRCCHSMLMQ